MRDIFPYLKVFQLTLENETIVCYNEAILLTGKDTCYETFRSSYFGSVPSAVRLR